MKIELIEWTRDAAELLILTKSTRLAANTTVEDIRAWPYAKILSELGYMRDTIKSSWEFVGYTFRISEVTRAFTHQLVRTRNGSYAQESQRTVNVADHKWLTPESLDDFNRELFDSGCKLVLGDYAHMIEHGAPVQDARGILPTNLHTSIIARFSLRTLHEMALVRLCTRTQGEYQDAFREMKAAVVAIHPWAEPFIRVACANDAICIFPRYEKCPISKYTYNGAGAGDRVREAHLARVSVVRAETETTRHEAVPVADKGRTM
jgi:flavin-dependent thymidylate synthase